MVGEKTRRYTIYMHLYIYNYTIIVEITKKHKNIYKLYQYITWKITTKFCFCVEKQDTCNFFFSQQPDTCGPPSITISWLCHCLGLGLCFRCCQTSHTRSIRDTSTVLNRWHVGHPPKRKSVQLGIVSSLYLRLQLWTYARSHSWSPHSWYGSTRTTSYFL